MAIKIIKPGELPDTTKRFECKHCGCVFEGEREDYRIRANTQYTLAVATECPTCGAVCYNYEAKIAKGENQ